MPLSDPKPMTLRLIGQMEAWSSRNECLLPSGRKARALLAILALSGPKPVLRIHAAELLWSRHGEDEARSSLRQELQKLHVAFAPAKTEIVVATRFHVGLRSEVMWIDVEEVMRATPDQPDALSLLNGDLLECLDGIDPSFDTWLTGKRQNLRDRARSVAEAALRNQFEPDAMIPAAKRLLQIDGAHEGAWRALMVAYAEKSEIGMAIQAYDQCRMVLASLFDAAPSNDTQQLLIAIRGPPDKRR
jgi:DNA-binding SARP family transcriptional activator